ncbi:MAG TPA: 2-dehydropantoate 2-reductase [Candidatus Dormibacteraeota bacterium]|nr:2-dehydropantoate 2-reductase [Candidatus Dormibacteraeota bacterium]
MRIAIFGAGGIGGFLAAALARSGADLAVVARGEHAEAIARSGLSVRSDLGAFNVALRVVARVEELESVDCAVLCVKAHQVPALCDQLAWLERGGASVVTMHNGLPFWFTRTPHLESVDPGGRIGAVVPDSAAIGGVVHVSGELLTPGTVLQSGGTRYVLAPLESQGAAAERCRQLVTVMERAGLSPELVPDVRPILWAKLANNVGLNAVSALTRLSIQPMLSYAPSRALVRALIEETLAVGRALGVVGEIDVDARMKYAARLSDVRTSMLQDVRAGKTLEIEPILGATSELARRMDTPTPTLDILLSLLRALERGLRA